ncbi:unnamed protein product [Eretmochelys imbricata]
MGLRGRRLLPLLLGLLLGPWCTGFSPPEPCQTCRDLASSFLKGLERTERENFGGREHGLGGGEAGEICTQ